MLVFNNPGSDNHYLDLLNTFILVHCKVKLANGNNLAAGGDCTVLPGDNFLHNLFSSVTLKIAGQDVEYEGNYPYRAMLANLLNYGDDAKKTHMLVSDGWFQDSAVCANFAYMADATVLARKRIISEGKTLAFYGKLQLSMFAQQRYLPPGMRFSLQLRRSESSFCLSATGNDPAGGAKVDITKCELYVRKVEANPALQKAHTDLMYVENTPIKYPINRIKTQFHVISAGVHSARINIEQNGQRPNKVIVGLVDHRAKSGNYTLNPFKFANYGLTSIELLSDGIPVGKRYEPEFAAGVYARPYMHLLLASGKGTSDSSCDISYQQCAANRCLYGFDNSGDLCEGGDGFHLVGNGTLSLSLAFAVATPHALGLLVNREKDDIITVDPQHNVTMVAGAM
jgi:hypothetical protein